MDSRTTLFLRFNISWRLLFEEEELQGSPFTYFDDLASQSYVFIAGENYFYGIIDQGFSASILWKQKKPIGFKNLSFVQSNNRNQSWIYSPSESSPLFILVDLMTGHQICQININSLLIGKNNSSSTSWIISSNVYSFGETSFTLLFVAQNQITFANQVVSLTVDTLSSNCNSKVLWTFSLPPNVQANSRQVQFNVLELEDNQKLVIFSTTKGVYGLIVF